MKFHFHTLRMYNFKMKFYFHTLQRYNFKMKFHFHTLRKYNFKMTQFLPESGKRVFESVGSSERHEL